MLTRKHCENVSLWRLGQQINHQACLKLFSVAFLTMNYNYLLKKNPNILALNFFFVSLYIIFLLKRKWLRPPNALILYRSDSTSLSLGCLPMLTNKLRTVYVGQNKF